MTLSIWRYSHFILAISSSLFLLIASITGCILALEPITHQLKGYETKDLKNLSLASTINALEQSFDEVFSLELESSGFVKTEVLSVDLQIKNYYINPRNAAVLGEVPERPSIFTFATNLHRSLFLKTTGRLFVSLVSILLVLIAVTGVILLIKRQGGILKIFSKVQKDYFAVRYHVILSRWFLAPIIIVALTGIYLSAEKFNLLPVYQNQQQRVSKAKGEDFSLDSIQLFDVKKVTFPFSNDPDEYLHIALKKQELFVSPRTGFLISIYDYPFTHFLSKFSFISHTGEGSVIWSIILFLSSASIIFFMYTGFLMANRRIKKGKLGFKNNLFKKEAEYIVLVGSETGTSYHFASVFCNALQNAGKKVYLDELNNYSQYPNATDLFVFAATYGDGEPTNNARKFESIFKSISPINNISFTVVGFGSLAYPKFCEYAVRVHQILDDHNKFMSTVPLFKINKASSTQFLEWINKWEATYQIKLSLTKEALKRPSIKFREFKILKKTSVNADNTFILILKPKQNLKYQSGDLLAFYPKDSVQPRYYSIAKINETIFLSIKKHDFGKVSNILYNLKEGDSLRAVIQPNPSFWYPSSQVSGILIANGTGIAPFLGMITEVNKTPLNLFWGGRSQESAGIYQEVLFSDVQKESKFTFHPAYSREGEYVQDLVKKEKELVIKTINNKGCIMICGSIVMQNGVLQILESFSPISIEELKRKGQLKMDCY